MSTVLRELTVLDQASRMLAEANSLGEIKAIRDKAEAARTYARAAQLGLDLQNRAAELKLRAERRAGQVLANLHLRGGDRRSKGRRAPLKLAELGISRDQSKRWQRIALVKETDFCKYLKAMNDHGREVTSAGLLRTSRKRRTRNGPLAMVPRPEAKAPNDTDSQELILELMNHCQLLADVLRPVYEGGDLAFQRGERRIVGRLLGEMNHLLRQLKGERPRAS